MLENKIFEDYDILKKHKAWYDELRENKIDQMNVDELLKMALTKRFVEVLEDAGVFKMNKEGIEAFIHFVENIEGGDKE